MPSKTITLRINLEALIGCGAIARANGIDTRAQPISTTIREVVEGLISWMVSQGQIPTTEGLSDSELLQAYKDMFDDPEVEGIEGLDFSTLGGFISPGSKRSPAEIAAEAEKHIREQEEPNIGSGTAETETVDISEDNFNLFKVNRTPFQRLKDMAPQDHIIVKVDKEIVSDVYKAAVEAVYTSLDVSQWGTPTAVRAIEDLVRRHQESNDARDSVKKS